MSKHLIDNKLTVHSPNLPQITRKFRSVQMKIGFRISSLLFRINVIFFYFLRIYQSVDFEVYHIEY